MYFKTSSHGGYPALPSAEVGPVFSVKPEVSVSPEHETRVTVVAPEVGKVATSDVLDGGWGYLMPDAVLSTPDSDIDTAICAPMDASKSLLDEAKELTARASFLFKSGEARTVKNAIKAERRDTKSADSDQTVNQALREAQLELDSVREKATAAEAEHGFVGRRETVRNLKAEIKSDARSNNELGLVQRRGQLLFAGRSARRTVKGRAITALDIANRELQAAENHYDTVKSIRKSDIKSLRRTRDNGVSSHKTGIARIRNDVGYSGGVNVVGRRVTEVQAKREERIKAELDKANARKAAALARETERRSRLGKRTVTTRPTPVRA